MQNDELTVESLRVRVGRERQVSGKQRVRFSEALKQDVTRFALATGWGIDRCAEALGLSRTGLHRWVRGERPRRKPHLQPARRRLVETEVTEEPRAVATDGLELRFPSGARITGLTFEQLRSLVVGQ